MMDDDDDDHDDAGDDGDSYPIARGAARPVPALSTGCCAAPPAWQAKARRQRRRPGRPARWPSVGKFLTNSSANSCSAMRSARGLGQRWCCCYLQNSRWRADPLGERPLHTRLGREPFTDSREYVPTCAGGRRSEARLGYLERSAARRPCSAFPAPCHPTAIAVAVGGMERNMGEWVGRACRPLWGNCAALQRRGRGRCCAGCCCCRGVLLGTRVVPHSWYAVAVLDSGIADPA